jgi:hypothetical protein
MPDGNQVPPPQTESGEDMATDQPRDEGIPPAPGAESSQPDNALTSREELTLTNQIAEPSAQAEKTAGTEPAATATAQSAAETPQEAETPPSQSDEVGAAEGQTSSTEPGAAAKTPSDADETTNPSDEMHHQHASGAEQSARGRPLHVRDVAAWFEGHGPVPTTRVVGGRIAQGLNLPDSVRPLMFWASAAFALILILAWSIATIKVVPTLSVWFRPYADSRYLFQIRDIAGFASQTGDEKAKVPCSGVVLQADNCADPEPIQCAQMRICFLGFTDEQQSAATALITRTQQITESLLSEAQPGLSRDCVIGRDKRTGQDVTLHGKLDGEEVKWHEVVLEFESRLYAVEDVCRLEMCGQYERHFTRIRDGLTFTKGATRTIR